MKRTLLTIGVVLYSIVTAQAQSRVTPDSQPRIGTSSPQLNPPRGRLGHLGSVPTPNRGVPPVITGYSPLFGPPGTVLTILGKGFGRPSTDSYVHILSAVTNTYTEWPSTNWNDTEIVVSVPSTMPLGKVFLIVEVNDVNSPDWHPFTVGVPPQITGYSAAYGDPGTVLTIHGTRFGPPLGSSNVSVLSSVTHTFTTWPATSWSDTQIVVSVPSATPLGKVYLYVLASRLASIGTYPFTVGDPPDITGYSAGYGDPGTVLTIHGTGFGTRQGSSAVFVLSAVTNTFTTWPAMSWSDTQILVPVPSTMPLGKVYLNVSVDGLASIGTYPFTVGVPPQIVAYSPALGTAGTVLTIHGTGFGTLQGSSAVFVLSAVTNTFTTWPTMSWSDTQILVPVPSTMPLGKAYLNVSADGLASIGTYPFEVQ